MSDTLKNALMGQRIEIPVHYDMWMRGARFGEVISFRRGKLGQSDYLLVRMEHPQVRKCLKLWRGDWEVREGPRIQSGSLT